MQDVAPRPAGRPLALFNATSVQSGLRITVGFPPLPRSILSPGLTLADVDPGISVNLAEAVRVSANFPYGFDYAVLDTLAMMFGRLVALADDPHSERERELQPAAATMLAELRKHGVLLLEIDAGARPSRPSWLAERLPSLSKPLQAMTQAAHLNASIVRERNIERIRQALVDGDAAPVPALVGVVRAGFDCRPKGDVMTAWALDVDDEAEILQGFMQIESRLTRSLQCSKHGAQPSDWDAFYDSALRCALGDSGACSRSQLAALHPPLSAGWAMPCQGAVTRCRSWVARTCASACPMASASSSACA